MVVSHGKSLTIADGANTDIVRPSDWNSAHSQALTIAGNTSGQSTWQGTNVILQGGDNLTLGINGNTLKFDGPSTHPPISLAAGTQTGSSGVVVLADSNNFTFGMAGSSRITASFSQSTHAHTQFSGGVSNLGNTAGSTGTISGQMVLVGGNNITLSQSTNGQSATVTVVGAAGGGSGGVALAAGTQTATSGTIVFSNANDITFGMEGSTRVTASFSQSTHAHTQFSGGVSNLGNTQGSTGTVSGQVVWAGGNNITLSQSTNGQSATVTIIGAAGGGGGAVSLYGFDPFYPGMEHIAGQVGNRTIYLMPINIPNYMIADRLLYYNIASFSSTATIQGTVSCLVGLYSSADLTQLSIVSTFSASTLLDINGTVNSSLYTGVRNISIGMGGTQTIPPGNYVLAIWSSTSSAGSYLTISNLIGSNMNSAFSGAWGQASNLTRQFKPFWGVYTATSTTLPDTIAASQVRGSAAADIRPPVVIFGYGLGG